MLVAEKVSRKSILKGWTPGLYLGVLFFVVATLCLHIGGLALQRDLLPCLFQVATGFPCPLCGGTRASFLLFSGHPLQALCLNPLVTFSLFLGAVWILSWLAFGLRWRLRLPDRAVALVLLALFLVNWIYVSRILL